jgi:hypothetical protein
VRFGDTGDGHDRLLDGENPSTTSQAVAARWVRVYGDLILAKDSLLTELGANIARALPEASYELERIDGSFLDAERARYRRRLAFWKARQADLARVER